MPKPIDPLCWVLFLSVSIRWKISHWVKVDLIIYVDDDGTLCFAGKLVFYIYRLNNKRMNSVATLMRRIAFRQFYARNKSFTKCWALTIRLNSFASSQTDRIVRDKEDSCDNIKVWNGVDNVISPYLCFSLNLNSNICTYVLAFDKKVYRNIIYLDWCSLSLVYRQLYSTYLGLILGIHREVTVRRNFWNVYSPLQPGDEAEDNRQLRFIMFSEVEVYQIASRIIRIKKEMKWEKNSFYRI